MTASFYSTSAFHSCTKYKLTLDYMTLIISTLEHVFINISAKSWEIVRWANSHEINARIMRLTIKSWELRGLLICFIHTKHFSMRHYVGYIFANWVTYVTILPLFSRIMPLSYNCSSSYIKCYIRLYLFASADVYFLRNILDMLVGMVTLMFISLFLECGPLTDKIVCFIERAVTWRNIDQTLYSVNYIIIYNFYRNCCIVN